jgi:hypothetical protein
VSGWSEHGFVLLKVTAHFQFAISILSFTLRDAQCRRVDTRITRGRCGFGAVSEEGTNSVPNLLVLGGRQSLLSRVFGGTIGSKARFPRALAAVALPAALFTPWRDFHRKSSPDPFAGYRAGAFHNRCGRIPECTISSRNFR